MEFSSAKGERSSPIVLPVWLAFAAPIPPRTASQASVVRIAASGRVAGLVPGVLRDVSSRPTPLKIRSSCRCVLRQTAARCWSLRLVPPVKPAFWWRTRPQAAMSPGREPLVSLAPAPQALLARETRAPAARSVAWMSRRIARLGSVSAVATRCPRVTGSA